MLEYELAPVELDLLKGYKIVDGRQADITRSLQSRLDIVCDEAEPDLNPADVGDNEEAEMSKTHISKLIFNSST